MSADLDYPLTATVQAAAGSGGTVTSASGPIKCDVGSGSCSASIEAGQTVSLTANPDAQSTFSSWSGCPSPSGATCKVDAMNQAESPVANFVLAPPTPTPPGPVTYPLSVTVNNGDYTGQTGYVSSAPTGIDCGVVPGGATQSCDADFDAATMVTLNQGPGSYDWISGCDSTSGPPVRSRWTRLGTSSHTSTDARLAAGVPRC